MLKIIQHGAEAKISLNKDRIIKDRIKKSYRLPTLDKKIRKYRTRHEIKILEKASKLIPVPKIISSSEESSVIELSFIDGLKLSENLDKLKESNKICKLLGKQLARLHDNDIIHGDLTTSNLIYSEKESKLYFIDFGLSHISARVEEKAVDLHLIKEALEARHFPNHKLFFEQILEGYKCSENYKKVINQFKKVEMRGRYKQQY